MELNNPYDLQRALTYSASYPQQIPPQYSRPPVYSPFQNRHNINDSFSYLANTFGPGLVQQAAGPDAFLMHQMPGQAAADQHSVAQYQQHVVAAIANASARGNDRVAQNLIGAQSFVNDGQPVTQLDREHAQIGAAVFNNPIFKGFAASQLPGGEKTLEGIMFGRRGDPAAIARQVGQMGFYRADATGGQRMSAKSMESFSTQLYNQLYGEDANLDEMRGFGAIETGEMMQSLFQQGRLPQSIGSLSAADRVRAMSASKRDEPTMTAMADDFAHRDLSARDYDYANATAEEQKRIRSSKLGDYRSQLDSVFQEADRFRANDPRAKSAAEIEQLSGFSEAANGVDAQRTANVAKQYTGALAAIRELFGDNGNSNAPIQELIAGLNQLAGGAQMSMSPEKLTSTVQEIRLAAKDAGISDAQLMQMSSEQQRRGMMLGLEPGNVTEGLKSSLLYARAMDQQGAHAKTGWGKISKAEAERAQQEYSARADASPTALALASLNRLDRENKQFAGTELAAAAEAYRKGEETYTYNNKTVNLQKLAATTGARGLFEIAQRSGASREDVYAMFNDRSGTKEYLEEGYAFNAQRYEVQRGIGVAAKQSILSKANDAGFKAKLKPAGMSDKDFNKEMRVVATGMANTLSDVVMNETADMTKAERVAHMEKRGKEAMTAFFQTKAGGNLSAAAAEQKATQYFDAIYGDTQEKRETAMNTAYSQMNTLSKRMTGLDISAQQQFRGKKYEAQKQAEAQSIQQRNERIQALSAGNESSMAQRVGEEFARASTGDSGTRSEILARLTNVISKDKMLQQYAPDAQDALAYTTQLYNSATITEEKISLLAEAAAAKPGGAEEKKLMELAGYDKTHTLTDAEKTTLVDRARMRSVGTAAGDTDAERATNKARQQRMDLMYNAFNTGNKDAVAAAATALAQETLGPQANQNVTQKFADAALAENPREFERQISSLPKEQQDAVRSTAAFLRASQKFGGLARAGLDQSAESVTAAASRPVALTREFKKQVSGGLEQRLMPEINNAEYMALRREKFGADTEMGRIAGENVVRQLSQIMSDVVVDEMGGAQDATPEERTIFLEKRAKEKLAAQFVRNNNKTKEQAEELANKQFDALLGTDKKKRQQTLDSIVTQTQEAATQQGIDTDTLAAARAEAVAAERAADAAADATIVPKTNTTAAVYDYKKLGVTDRVTAEQQQIIDNIKRNPSAAYIDSLMQNEQSKKLLLSLPDAAAVDVFNTFTPEQRAKGLAEIKRAAELGPIKLGIAATQGYHFTKQDQQNLDRLHTTLSRSAGNQNLPPVSLQSADPLTGLLEAVQQFTGQGGALPNMVIPTSEAALVDEEMAAIESRMVPTPWYRSGQGDKEFASDDDKTRVQELQQRKKELASGDPLRAVREEMAEIDTRKRKGWWSDSRTPQDQERYEMLEKREKAIMADGGAMIRQEPAGVAAARNTTGAAAGGPGGAMGGGGSRGVEALRVSGTLTLNGLHEAILNATGQQFAATPDGAPVGMGVPTGR